MNGFNLIVTGINVLIKLMPPPKPPKIDYSPLYKAIPSELPDITVVDVAPESVREVQETEFKQLPAPQKGAVATSCIACSRSHMATIAGALEESIRFARDNGIMDPEVIRRIDAAEKEVTMMERIDLSPEAIQNSPPKDQEMARAFLPLIRKLRQDIGQIASVDQLEETAAEASVLTHEFRLRQMQEAGVNLNPILELAKRVQAGELTVEEARAKVKEYLPKEA